MPYRAIRCMICKEDDKFVSFMWDEPGKKKMIAHMRDEHDEEITLEVFGD